MTTAINNLIAEARKLGLTDSDWQCIKDAHGILTEKEIIKALEKFIEKGSSPYIKISGKKERFATFLAFKIKIGSLV